MGTRGFIGYGTSDDYRAVYIKEGVDTLPQFGEHELIVSPEWGYKNVKTRRWFDTMDDWRQWVDEGHSALYPGETFGPENAKDNCFIEWCWIFGEDDSLYLIRPPYKDRPREVFEFPNVSTNERLGDPALWDAFYDRWEAEQEAKRDAARTPAEWMARLGTAFSCFARLGVLDRGQWTVQQLPDGSVWAIAAMRDGSYELRHARFVFPGWTWERLARLTAQEWEALRKIGGYQ